MNWKYESIDDHQEYSAAVDELEAIKLEINHLQHEIVPQKKQEYDVLKRKSIETETVSWHQVEEAKQELERALYKLELYKEKASKQAEVVEDMKSKARDEINEEARSDMMKALEKSVRGYEMLMEASNDLKQIKSKQSHALKLSSGERKTYRNSQVMPIPVPNPFRDNLNDLWYKRAKSYIDKNA